MNIKLYLLFVVSIIEFSSKSQPSMINLQAYVTARTFRVIANFVNEKGETQRQVGMGMVLQGKYLATCYHIITPKPGWKLIDVDVFYHYNFAKDTADSVKALTDGFKAGEGQFDFSTHTFDPKDNLTDFVVLPLAIGIPPVDYVFSSRSDQITAPQPLFIFGNDHSIVNGRDNVSVSYAATAYLFSLNRQRQTDTANKIYHGIAGQVGNGFSGAPVFDQNGEVIGICDFGWDTLPPRFVEVESQNPYVSPAIIQATSEAFQHGDRMVFATDIQYILKTYLSGYQ